MGEPTLSDQLSTAKTATQLLGHLARERLWPKPAKTVGDIPRQAAQITADWLTLALCQNTPKAQVLSIRFEAGSKGTSERHRVSLKYNDAGVLAGLPESIFIKLTPGFFTSFAHSATGSMAGETWFYQDIKPRLIGEKSIESPHGYFSAHDLQRSKSIQLIEDLTQSKTATFCDIQTEISKHLAESMVVNLATLHAAFYRSPLLTQDLNGLHNFTDFFHRGRRTMSLRKYHLKGLHKARDILPEAIRKAPEQSWEAICKATEAHNGQAPHTICHGDVHLANWYITENDQMGLLDWQVLNKGHWSRDLAYWMSSCLSIEQRRNWEDFLLDRYRQRFAEISGVEIPPQSLLKAYRQQLLCALAFWTPTYAPPALLPNDMQPEELALEMIIRMCTAIDDHDSINRVMKDNWIPNF